MTTETFDRKRQMEDKRQIHGWSVGMAQPWQKHRQDQRHWGSCAMANFVPLILWARHMFVMYAFWIWLFTFHAWVNYALRDESRTQYFDVCNYLNLQIVHKLPWGLNSPKFATLLRRSAPFHVHTRNCIYCINIHAELATHVHYFFILSELSPIAFFHLYFQRCVTVFINGNKTNWNIFMCSCIHLR